jgi:flagellar biosynthesis chaperone FliJ
MMQKASAPVVIILIILVLISLSVAGGGFYLLQKEKTRSLELEQKLEELNTKQRITQDRLRESERLIADLQIKLQDAKSQIDTLTQDLDNEKNARQQAEGRLEQLKAELDEQKGFRSDLENKLSKAQEDVKKTANRLKELEKRRTDLESKIQELEEKSKQIELGKIVVSPEGATAQPVGETTAEAVPGAGAAAETLPPAQAQPPKSVGPVKETETNIPGAHGLEGKVLVINKDYNFVVINLGTKDGVKIGDIFAVYHSDKYLGDVKIEKVHDSMAAAGFVTGDIKDKTYEGDKVVQKVK